MSFLLDGLREALGLILRFDGHLAVIVLTTLTVSVTSCTIAALISLPTGFLLASRSFSGKRWVLVILKTALAFPTVLVALVAYALLMKRGPFGALSLLFTPPAIIFGQVLLVVPLLTALVHATLQGSVRTVHEEALLLGASPARAFWKTLVETRVGILTALMTGFGRVVSEIGISLILGGNIRGLTRTMTTAIALESGQGNFSEAVALGLLLLLLVLIINITVQMAEARSEAI
jgi:tungstate transport system permease protein